MAHIKAVMAYWLLKSEPDVYDFSRLQRDGKIHWDGVRNHQAANNLRAMAVGDKAFFYHSNIGKEIVGVVTIIKTAYPDPGDKSGKFVMVDIGDPQPLPKTVNLARLQQEPELKELRLLKQSRLSVVPITAKEWKIICRLGGNKES